MYVPASFAERDIEKLHAFVRQNSFAVLVTHGEEGTIASHLPLLLDAERAQLIGHMARANPQWRRACGEALAVFTGPHAYISPSWYAAEGTVPTWNYLAVHVSGPFQTIDDRDELLDVLRRTVAAYEGAREVPWAFDASAPHVREMLSAIVGFRIPIARIEGKWKLGQNHPEERRRNVVRALSARPDENSRAIAELMAETLGDGKPSAVAVAAAPINRDRAT